MAKSANGLAALSVFAKTVNPSHRHFGAPEQEQKGILGQIDIPIKLKV